ncbi:cysteine proteinase [Thermothelomyces heterothallicus CBS 203.75]
MKRPRKRLLDETADGPDELTDGTRGKQAFSSNAGQPSGVSPMVDAPSLSKRGDMKRTNWPQKTGTDIAPAGVSIQAAVCEPNFRYIVKEDQPCFLRPSGMELHVFTRDGDEAEPCDWLKITNKAKLLAYHPESSLIKISQAMDPSALIGGLMMLKFRSKLDVSWVVNWARDNLGLRLVQESESHRLHMTWDNLNSRISQAGSQASTKRLPNGNSHPQPRAIEKSPKANAVLSEGASPSTSTSARTPLRRQMQVSAQQSSTPRFQIDISGEHASHEPRSLRSGRTIRQLEKLDSPPLSTFRRWSDENSDWAKDWETPLIVRRTTVDKEDIPRLDEGQCLNDNLIGYGLRYLFDEHKNTAEGLRDRVYLHNSFFYEKLKAPRGAINYDGVKNWTAKVDLLSYDYIIVPVNEHYHWWVAIICNPGKLDPDSRRLPAKRHSLSDEQDGKAEGEVPEVEMTDVTQKWPSPSPEGSPASGVDLIKSDIVDLVSEDKHVGTGQSPSSKGKRTRKAKHGPKLLNPDDPRIITLDSLGSTHTQAIGHLKKYLLAEFEHKRHKVITETPPNFGMRAKRIPEQNNLCDCGIYLLGYIQQFVENPDRFIQKLLREEPLEWDFDPSHLRQLWRETILSEKRSQRKKQPASQGSRCSSTAVSTPKKSTTPSRHTSPETSENRPNGASEANREAKDGSSELPASTKAAESPAKPITLGPDEDRNEPQHPPRAGSNEQPQPSAPSSSIAAQTDSANDGDVLESIEPSEPTEPENPTFIRQLSSSTSTKSADDGAGLLEVDSKESKFPARPKRVTYESTTKGQDPVAKSCFPHTSGRFVVDSSMDLDPVVEKAEMVREPDSIDLTSE